VLHKDRTKRRVGAINMAMPATTAQPAPGATHRGAGDIDTPMLGFGRSTPGTMDANTAPGDHSNTQVCSNARGEVWRELSKQTPTEFDTLLEPEVMLDFEKITTNEVYHMYDTMARFTYNYRSQEEHRARLGEHLPVMFVAFNNLTTRGAAIGTFFFNVKTAILLACPSIADPCNPRSDFMIKKFSKVEDGNIAVMYDKNADIWKGHNWSVERFATFEVRLTVATSVALIRAYREIQKFVQLNYTYRMLQTKNLSGQMVPILSAPTGESVRLHPMWEDYKNMKFTIDYSLDGSELIRFRDMSMPDRVARRGDESFSIDLEWQRKAEEQADRNAADLLSQLDKEESASKDKATRKAARNRASKLKKNKSKRDSEPPTEQLASIVEDDEVQVQKDAEPSRTSVFKLSDIRFALTPTEDDTATSVATELMCVICMSDERSVACVPCGHKCLCEGCGTHAVAKYKCPMCREPIMMFMRVFE